MPGTLFAERLQDLLLDIDELEGFLHQLSAIFAELAAAETGQPVLCSLRVVRPRQRPAFGASDLEALGLDRRQDDFADGPALEVLKTGQAILVPDTAMDPRWRRYQRAAAQRGIRSILGVSLVADPGTAATLSLFSPAPEAFDDGAVAAVEDLALGAANMIRLAIRLEAAQSLNRDLLEALQSRTPINLATGILMAQSRCSQSEAFGLLTRVSNSRNVKLRVVAQEILERFDAGSAGADFTA